MFTKSRRQTHQTATYLQRRPRRMVSRTWVLILSISGLILSSHYWLPYIGGFLIVSNPLRHVDALVPLAGARYRVTYTVDVYKQGYADWFALTDMKVGLSDEPHITAVIRQAIDAGIQPEQIIAAPGTATTTYNEAELILNLAQQQKWDSIMIITSPYHTRRSSVIFNEVFHGSGIAITIRAVTPHWYTAQTWWTSRGNRYATAFEYLKFVAHFVGYDTNFDVPQLTKDQ